MNSKETSFFLPIISNPNLRLENETTHLAPPRIITMFDKYGRPSAQTCSPLTTHTGNSHLGREGLDIVLTPPNLEKNSSHPQLTKDSSPTLKTYSSFRLTRKEGMNSSSTLRRTNSEIIQRQNSGRIPQLFAELESDIEDFLKFNQAQRSPSTPHLTENPTINPKTQEQIKVIAEKEQTKESISPESVQTSTKSETESTSDIVLSASKDTRMKLRERLKSISSTSSSRVPSPITPEIVSSQKRINVEEDLKESSTKINSITHVGFYNVDMDRLSSLASSGAGQGTPYLIPNEMLQKALRDRPFDQDEMLVEILILHEKVNELCKRIAFLEQSK